MKKTIIKALPKRLKMLPLIVALSLSPVSNRILACEGSCECGYSIQVGGFTIYSEHYEYWGSGNCCSMSAGAIYCEYVEMGYSVDFGISPFGFLCCGKAYAGGC